MVKLVFAAQKEKKSCGNEGPCKVKNQKQAQATAR